MRPLANGTVLHDRYRIIRPIGKGGMGAIYEAVDVRLENTVAVKQMAIDGADAERAFEREARLLAGLRHAALPVVIDYFVDDGRHFIVMQYIEGEDLARVLQRQNGPCAAADVLDWADAALDALAYLHDHRPPIVHRDIKPANLKRTPSGDVVLLDFGLAKGSAGACAASDAERSLLGFTLKYAPLEQIAGHGTDARSDIFSLGATLYHLATGLPPPTAVDRVGALNSGRHDPLRNAIVVNPAIPEVLSRALTRALEIDPSGRFQSALEMRAALVGDRTATVAKPSRARGTATSQRRIDAAMPSQAEVGRQTDLIVQVRFADSPLLGLEDWPTARRPAKIEQASEAIELTHPENPVTGALLPARLRVRLVAPDFTIEGQAEQVIDVPPDNYSKRITFLVMPRRAGYCRVNVEVYTPDAVYLGTVPVEAEALGGGIAQPIIRVATLMLGVLARRVAEAIHRAPDASTIAVDQFSPPESIQTELAAPQPTVSAPVIAYEQTAAATVPFASAAASATTVPAPKREATLRVEDGSETTMVTPFPVPDKTIVTPMPFPVQPSPPPPQPTAPPPTGRTVDPRQRRKQQIDRLMDTATREMDSGEIDRALEAVDQVLFLDPENADAATLSRRAQAILDRQRVDGILEQARMKLSAGDSDEGARNTAEEAGARKAAEEAAKKKAAEEAASRKAEEAREAEEARKAEAARKAEEARGAEAARKEAAGRAAEQRARAAREQSASGDATGFVPPSADYVTTGEPASQPMARDAGRTQKAVVPPELRAEVAPRAARAAAAAATATTAAESLPRAIRVPAPVERPGGPMGTIVGIAAAAVLVVSASVFMMKPSSPKTETVARAGSTGAGSTAPTSGPVDVSLNVTPWAKIDAITSTADNKPVDASCPATPCIVTVPPGRYTVTASNPNYLQSMTFAVTIRAGEENVVAQTLPDFKVSDAVSRIQKVNGSRSATAPPAMQPPPAPAVASGGNPRAYEPYRNGMNALRRQQYDAAIPLLEAAIAIDPTSAANRRYEATLTVDYFPQYYLFYALVKTGQFDRARRFAHAPRPPAPRVADFQTASNAYDQWASANTKLEAKADTAMARAEFADFDRMFDEGLTRLLNSDFKSAKQALATARQAPTATPAQRAMAHAYLAVAYGSIALSSKGATRAQNEMMARDEYRQAGGYELDKTVVSPAVLNLLAAKGY